MCRRSLLAICICSLWACGGGTTSGDPGPLVDNTQWEPSDQGAELFGTPPEDSQCLLTPQDCPEYPWPEDGCVTYDPASTCIASYVPECFDNYTVLSVYTRMPDNRFPRAIG